ncbi:MAG: hypothetical protein VKP62_12445 [Candidatus Sericytochromatia bacterium]|nr:hypothetical protein [Candidatus Sericytochromatia bacterium]
MEAFNPSAQNPTDMLEVLENLSRRRRSARGVNAVVVVKSGEPGQEQLRKPEATITPVAPSERLGMVVSEAVATAIATQTDMTERYVEAARRINELENQVKALEQARDEAIRQQQERARAHDREREMLTSEFHDRLSRVEAERDLLADELAVAKRQQLDDMVERLAEALSPRLSGVLDEHTSLADRYAKAVHRIGELEGRLEAQAAQARPRPSWHQPDASAPAPRAWWQFWR